MSDLVFLSASQLAKAIRDRSVSALEVLEAHLAQIAQHNPVLNAIVTLDEEQAKRRALQADAALAQGELWGPLHGVPVTIKDLFDTAGLRTTWSYRPLANYIPQQDATAIARLRAAGAILIGKTNMPELAIGPQCDSPLFGRANNPWNLNCTPGGSTGGGAAAVAAERSLRLTFTKRKVGGVTVDAAVCSDCLLTKFSADLAATGTIRHEVF